MAYFRAEFFAFFTLDARHSVSPSLGVHFPSFDAIFVYFAIFVTFCLYAVIFFIFVYCSAVGIASFRVFPFSVDAAVFPQFCDFHFYKKFNAVSMHLLAQSIFLSVFSLLF